MCPTWSVALVVAASLASSACARDAATGGGGWLAEAARECRENASVALNRLDVLTAASPEQRSAESLEAAVVRALRILDTDAAAAAQGRRRHRHKDGMMGIVLFGVLAMTVIAIPLGFQFLAVLGGKALMLAKLALILTSIQGLKKIATSNFGYGLYHAPAAHAHAPGLYDRGWPPARADAEHEGFDAVEPHSPDGILRPRIVLPRMERPT